jgi:ankyrin repeat protein
MYACGGHVEALEAFLPFIGDDIYLAHRALAWAADVGSSKVIARLLQHPGVDVNTAVNGKTALYRACAQLHPAVVATLLQAGADPNINCDVLGGRSLNWAYDKENPAKLNCFFALCDHSIGGEGFEDKLQTIFVLLMEAGVNIDYRTPLGETALHSAARSPVLVRLLLEAGADANVTNCFGTTPLHITHTIGHNSLQSIVLLVEQGHANINAVQADGRTPLHCLLSSQNEGSAEKFLEYNPNCNVIDNKGNNLLHILMEGYMPNLEIIKSLLKRGTDPNGKNYEGLTPLLQLYHVNLNYTQIIESFLEAGADINAVDRDGNSLFFRLLSSHPGMYGGDSHKYLTYLIDRGVSPSQRNFHGQTALHMAVECHRTKEVYGGPRSLNMSRLNFLISLNLDVKAVDYSGNSLLHVLALRSDNHHRFIGDARLIPLWKKLIDLGLDLEQKNHAGRTPLHILCTTNTRLLRLTPGKLTPIDFVISRVKNLDVPDNDGITPLHIAVTCGEKFAKKLIDAGANPLVYTHEGLIPLHLAARCRDSNNVGLLLGAMRKQQREIPTISQLSETDSISLNKKATGSEIVVGIDTKALDNCNAITPLFYACSSGRPETVALLLEAGADAKMGNIFEAFLEFEEECCLWKQPQPLQNDGALEHTSPLKLSDVYRYTGYNPSDSEVPGLSSNDTARLEEIIDMLINYRADLSHLENHNGSQQGGIINRAVAKNNDYTAACLKRVVKKSPLSSETEKCRDELTRLSEAMNHHQKEASIQALRSSELVNTADQGQGQMVGLNVLTRFLIRREYHLVEELGQLGANFLPKSMTDEHCSLYHLIRLGLASLVEKIGHREAELMLTKGDWHAFGDNKRPGLWHKKRHNSNSQLIPFILVAVQRELPNMDVVRLLVEKLAVDIHEIDASGECALFHVTRGYHWWHVHQALPYLLNAGVDIQLRNGKGQTPLHIALQGDDQAPGLYSWDAAKLLIERGADVNAVDSSGQSCLACARHNAEMIKLLIKYGAAVTPDSIFAAIDSRSAKVLRALLSGGMNPNSRRNKSSLQTNEGSQQSDVEPHEQFPLYYAAMKIHLRWQPSNQDYQDIPEAVEIVQVLLDHGADPFAKFLKQDTQAKGELNLSVAGNPFTQVSGGYSERTLLHEVLFAGCFVDIFLQLPDLDVHHQDTKGRTLLHMICENRNGPDHIVGSYVKNSDCVLKERVHAFQQLLSLGANLKAQDNFGRNVLHYMLVGEVDIKPSTCARFFAYTLQNAPDLLNQGDYNGETPLHYAMIRALDRNITGEAEMLLEAGADYMIISKRGDTLLHMLGRGLAIAVLRQFFQDLVGRGVDLNARNARGETALFSFYNCPKTDPNALYFNDVNRPTGEYAKPMLENLGGDFFIKDNKGRGLLHAAAGGDVERFQELMDMGLDPMMEDNSQQTAIDIAAACGNREILELFKKKKDLDSLL